MISRTRTRARSRTGPPWPARVASLLWLATAAATAQVALPARPPELAASGPTSSVKPLPDDRLFNALGGRAGLVRLTDEFVARLVADPRTGPFFQEADKVKLRAQLVDQFCEVAGGPCTLVGKNMKDVHGGLDITKGDFNAVVEVLQAAMDAQAIPFGVQNRLLAQLAPMHRDIVNH